MTTVTHDDRLIALGKALNAMGEGDEHKRAVDLLATMFSVLKSQEAMCLAFIKAMQDSTDRHVQIIFTNELENVVEAEYAGKRVPRPEDLN